MVVLVHGVYWEKYDCGQPKNSSAAVLSKSNALKSSRGSSWGSYGSWFHHTTGQLNPVSLCALKRQIQRIMRARPASHWFAHSPDNWKFVGIGPWRKGADGWSWSEARLETSSLASPAHLSPTDQKGEGRRPHLGRQEASFWEDVSGLAGRTPRTGGGPGTRDCGWGGRAGQRPVCPKQKKHSIICPPDIFVSLKSNTHTITMNIQKTKCDFLY